jgi:hypothetical protein
LLIEGYETRYAERKDLGITFDVPRLLAFLQSTYPSAAQSHKLAAGLEVSCVEALKTVGLGTPLSLKRMFQSSRFHYAQQSFAALQGIAPADISHLARVVLAVATKNAAFIQHHFPEMKFDPAVRQFVERRAARRRA